MTDLALTWIAPIGADLLLDGPDLATDEGLYTACLISLFSDRLARADDALPDGDDDRRGWWGDTFNDIEGDLIGSRLWLLERSKRLPEILVQAKEYAEEALAWLIADKVAAGVAVETEWLGQDGLAIGVVITRPDGSAGRFDYVWNL